MSVFIFTATVLILSHSIEAISNGTPAVSYSGRRGVALIDSTTETGHSIQCSGALISQKHILTSKICCSEQSDPTVILGTTTAYSEQGERFRTIKHCWISHQPRWLDSLQTCLLTLSRLVDFRDTVLPYQLPITHETNPTNLIGFGFGSTTHREYGISEELWALPMALVKAEECMIPDSATHHECARPTVNMFGMLNHNDVGGPITTDVNMELYGLAGSWYMPSITPGMPQYRSIILPIFTLLEDIYNEMENLDKNCLKI